MKNTLVAAIIGLSFIIGTYFLANAIKNRNEYKEGISVKGLAKENFTSDLIVWRGRFFEKSYDQKEAFSKLKNSASTIHNYLKSKGVPASDIVISAISTSEDYEYYYDENGKSRKRFMGYILSQEVRVESNNVDLVEKISREITELLDQGIQFSSENPEYYYTKLEELKVKMIANATANAKQRAENIATESGGKLGGLKDAQLGIFQITGRYSNEDYTWGGAFNTRDKDKTASITVSLEYEVK